MKTKYLLLFAATSLVAACSNQDVPDSIPQSPANLQVVNNRSYDEALQIAESSASLLNGSASTRSAADRKVDVDKTKVCLSASKTRSADSDTLFYVFNYEDEQGFAVVSARKSQSLLAITEKGSYDPDEETDSKDFDCVMELAKQYVLAAGNDDDPAPVVGNPVGVIADEYTYDVISSKGNFITLNWGEGGVEAIKCSNLHVGSFNLATAMLLAYYEYPEDIDLNYPGMTFNAYPLAWSAIKVHVKGHANGASTCGATMSAHNSIAYLCRQIGKLSGSVYGTGSTTTDLSAMTAPFPTLDYTCSQYSYTQSRVNQYLNHSHPLIVSGSAGTERGTWLVDGYQYCAVTVREVAYHTDGSSEVLSEMSLGNKYYNHINWGMKGSYNGYFLAGIFDIVNPRPISSSFASPIYSGTSDFSSNVVIFYAYPNN